MKIQRTIAMSPIEPAQMSLRLPSGMPLTLDLQYLDQAGVLLASDLGGQLQLTGRSDGVTSYFSAPATDIVNGKARVSIGGDTLTDMNGYRLRLTGTWRNEATLLALGTLRLTEAAGAEAVPQDVIDDVPIALSYNFDASISVRLWQDAGKGAPFDLATATITASVYPGRGSNAALTNFTVTPTMLPGEVLLGLAYTVVNTLPPSCWWSLRASNAAGVTTLCQGSVTISGIKP